MRRSATTDRSMRRCSGGGGFPQIFQAFFTLECELPWISQTVSTNSIGPPIYLALSIKDQRKRCTQSIVEKNVGRV
jgi:hypothetical protein